MDYARARMKVVEYLRKQLIGPASDQSTLYGISPLERYPTGVLFPVIHGEEGIDPASISEDEDQELATIEGGEENLATAIPAIKRRRYTPRHCHVNVIYLV